jgi:hypothetical protein
VIGLLVTSGLVLRRSDRSPDLGYPLAFFRSAFYAVVSVWHFIEHYNGNDPEIAHVLMYIGTAGMIIGALIALVGRAAETAARLLE